MDYGASFTFVTQDEEWIKKLGIASALALFSPLLGITLIPLLGWMLEISRRVAANEQPTLPEWDNFGGYFATGIKAVVLFLVWLLPIFILSACLAGAGALAPSMMPDAGDAGILILVLNLCIVILVLPYAIVIGILAPAALGTLGVTGELGAAINPGNAWRLVRGNLSGYIVVWLIASFVPSILTSIGSIVCGIGAAVGIAYGMALLGHLYGQAYSVSNTAPAEDFGMAEA